LKHLAEWLLPLHPLKRLNASDNLLQELPFSLLRLTALTQLNVELNPFEDPPREVVVAGQRAIFRYLHTLNQASTTNTIDFSRLGLRTFPVCHCDRTSLTKLTLDQNELESLPTEIAKLLKLEHLTLRGNNIRTLPLTIGLLGRLKTLDVGSNPIVTPPTEVCKLGAQAMVGFLGAVLSNMNLTSVPEVVMRQTGLTQLDLSGNSITELSDVIVTLTSLTELNIDDNQLKAIPEEIGLLVNLQRLSLQSNQLKFLPPSVGDLQKLRTSRSCG
ncbi:hypothetical protein T484DRAFT_1827279, partial [Baffinella frigidus]